MDFNTGGRCDTPDPDMRPRALVPWTLVVVTALGGAQLTIGLGPIGLGSAVAQAIKEPGWPPPEGAACKPSKKDTEEAKTLFGLGKNAHDTSNYTDAIKYYKDAYKRDCTAHLLLKNLGKVYEADGQYAAAVEVYKLFRARGKPAGEELDLLDAKIANLSKKVAPSTTETAPTGTGTGTGTAPTGTGTGTAPTGTASVVPTDTAPSSSGTTVPTTPPPSSGPGVGPYIVIGAGGVLTVAGVILGVTGNSKVVSTSEEFAKLNCAPPNTPLAGDLARCNQLSSDGKAAINRRNLGWVLTGVGVAAVGGGVVWLLLGGKKSEPAKAGQITLVPGPGTAGIGLAGAF